MKEKTAYEKMQEVFKDDLNLETGEMSVCLDQEQIDELRELINSFVEEREREAGLHVANQPGKYRDCITDQEIIKELEVWQSHNRKRL